MCIRDRHYGDHAAGRLAARNAPAARGVLRVNVLIVGYGKMGQLIDALAGEQGIEVAGRVDEGRDEWRAADVAIDFTTADALLANFPRYLQLKMPVVIGTTGWHEHAAALRARARAS